MKKARMNISHSRFILSKLKIFGEIVTTKFYCYFEAKHNIALAKCSGTLFRKVINLVE